MKPTVIDLFCGAGGLSEGFRKVGFKSVFANDILENALKTYEINQPENNASTVKRGDIAGIPSKIFENLRLAEKEGIDVVFGGPPCQDFSIVRGPERKRKGIKVERGKLYSHFIRALIHSKPKVFVFENVPGLANVNKGESYKTILKDFSDLRFRYGDIKKDVNNSTSEDIKNYRILYNNIVDASKLGVPQKRRRLIIIGVREDVADSLFVPFSKLVEETKSSLKGHDSVFGKYPLTPIEVFSGRPLSELDGTYKELMKEYENIWQDVGTEYSKEWHEKKWNSLSFDIIKDYLFINNIKSNDDGEVEEAFKMHTTVLKELGYYGRDISKTKFEDGTNRMPAEKDSVRERMKRIPPDENYKFADGTEWAVKGRGMSLIYRRLHPLKPACTVVAYGGGGTWGYHYERGRSRLTNRERARLQTFPDSFVFNGNGSEVRAQIGEAVPPLMAKAVAERVSSILKKRF